MLQALRNRNVAVIFSAQVVSIAGDLVLFIALPFWVYQLTGSALATGIMMGALTLPQLLISPLAGVVVDRADRKRLMIGSDLLRAILMLGYFFVNDVSQVWLIYLLAFAESAVSQFFRPAVNAVVPTLVNNEEELTRANSLLGASWALGQMVGPALGGILVTTYGPHGAALFDMGTYLLSAALLLWLHLPSRAQVTTKFETARHAVQQFTSELREGVRVALERPLLRVIFASLAILMLSQGIINVLLVVIVKEIWHAGATEFGWFVTAQGVGGLVGAVIISAFATRISPKHLVVVGGSIAGLLIMVMVNQPSVYVAMGLMLVAVIAIVAFDIGLTTLIQIGSDDANRGRISGLMQTAMAAAQLVSIAATSLLADQLGAALMLNVAAILFTLGGLVAILAPNLHLAPNPTTSIATQPAE